MSTRYGGWIYIFCFLLVSGFARRNGPAGQSGPPVSVPAVSAARLMTLDVVVTDKSGKPVSGLEQRDFTLLDNKQPREIVSFHAVEAGAAAADPPVEVVLLVDTINNTSFKDVAFERSEIEKFLRRNGGALAQPVSMVVFSDSGVTGATPFRDGNAVIADLNRKLDPHTFNRAQGDYDPYERIQVSLGVLQKLADYEAARPGRKLVIWISPGWPYLFFDSNRQEQEPFGTIVAVSDGLRRARITLYNIDPLGVADAGSLRTSDYRRYLKAAKTAEHASYGNLALQVLASQSGGRVLNSGNDVAGEIAACVADASGFYVLSFDGHPGDGPNEYHALEIHIGKPGLTARTRSGYYAQPE